MKRILSLVLAMVMVLGSFSAVFAVEPTVADEAVEVLMDLGVLTEGKLDQELKRQDAIVLLSRLMGEEEVAKDFPSEELAFEDVIDPFYTGYVAWAVSNKLTEGKSKTKFGFGDKLKTQELAMFMLRVLGYEDVKYDDALTKAAELGVLVDVAEGTIIKRGDMAVMTLNALKANPKDSTVTLAEKLGLELPVEEVVVPAALEVVSVSATNLKEIVVIFNQEVDKDTVVAANFSLNPVAGNLAPVLGEDGKTVTITTQNALSNQGKYKLTVDKIATLTEVKIAKVVVEFTAFDATLPTVEQLVITGPKTFDLIFSEPINTAGTVTVKSANTTLAVQSSPTTGTNKVTVTLYTTLVDGTDYNVTVQGYADFAVYNNVIKTVSFTYAKDITAPVVSLVSANQQYAVVKFNKPVTGLDLNYFYHTFSAWKPMGIYATKADMDAGTPPITTTTPNVTTVYVQFATTGAAGQFPLQPGNVNINVLGNLGTTVSAVKDNWGNALATTVLTTNIIADLEAPTVTKVEATGNQTIAITFSKAVAPGAVANYEVLKSDGTAVSGLTFTVSALSATKVQLNLSKNMIGETVLVNVKNIEDTTLNKNKLVGTSTSTITFEDKQFDDVSRVEFDAPNKVIYVVYSEAMNDSAIDMANYKLLDGSTVRSLTGPAAFFGSNKVVKIELTADQAAWITVGTDKLLIANSVKDLAGNGPTAFQLELPIINIGSSKPTVVANGIKAIDKNTVTVQFNQELVSVNPADFSLNDGAPHAPTALALSNNSTGTLVTLTFNTNILANVPGTVKLNATFAPNSTTVNVFNVTATDIVSGTVLDRIAPTLSTKVLNTTGTITLTYDENINGSSVSIYTYTVAGNTVSNVNVSTNTVVLTLGTPVAPDATPSVTQVLDIQDAAGNKLAPSAAVTVADKVAPMVVSYNATTAPTSFKVVSATSITVVFTEKLDATKFLASNANGFAVAGGTATLTNATLSADGLTVTLTGTDFVAGTTTVAYTAGTLTDLAANALATFGAVATN